MTLSSFPCAQMLKTNTRYVHDFAKANADRDGQRAVHEYRQRGERPAVHCGGYCGEHKAWSAGKHRLFSGDCGLSKLAETLFHLQKTGATRDHAAVGLLQTRQGVCQAIAALSMVILPHLGILARYVCGEGYPVRIGVRTRGTRYGRRTSHGTRSISHSACTAKRRRTRLRRQMIFPFASCTAGTK